MKYRIKDLHFVTGMIRDVAIKIVPIIFNKDGTKVKDLLTNKVYNNDGTNSFEKQIAQEYHFDEIFENEYSTSNFIHDNNTWDKPFVPTVFYDEEDKLSINKIIKTIKSAEKFKTKCKIFNKTYAKRILKEAKEEQKRKIKEEKYENDAMNF